MDGLGRASAFVECPLLADSGGSGGTLGSRAANLRFRLVADVNMLFVSSSPRMATVLLLALLTCCFGLESFAVARDGLMSREQGLDRAREVAKEDGRDLARYELDTFGDELTEDRSEWMFVFQCKPMPAPPGCHFMVVVDRRTGDARLFPGE